MKKLLVVCALVLSSHLAVGVYSYNMGVVWSVNLDVSGYSVSNSGSYTASSAATFSTTNLTNNGSISAGTKLTISSSWTGGSGSFNAPVIEIYTDEFVFTGSITCSKRCIIETKKPVVLHSFTTVGDGDFLIFDKNRSGAVYIKYPGNSNFEEIHGDMPEDKRKEWFKLFSDKELQSFNNKALGLSQQEIKEFYDQLLACTSKFCLDDSYALDCLKKIADDYTAYYEPLKDKKTNDQALLAGGALVTGGFIASIYGYVNGKNVFTYSGGAASIAGLLGIAIGLNPDYKAKYEKSCELQAQLAELR